jgi:hypothetical protein
MRLHWKCQLINAVQGNRPCLLLMINPMKSVNYFWYYKCNAKGEFSVDMNDNERVERTKGGRTSLVNDAIAGPPVSVTYWR